jgi:flagellar basal-body rod modification protein FlgD
MSTPSVSAKSNAHFDDLKDVMTKSNSSSSSTTTTSSVSDKNTFMTLLVAQLKNQNPLSPADGTQFVTQLAQFTTLEKTTSIDTNLQTIESLLTKSAAAASTTKTTTTP